MIKPSCSRDSNEHIINEVRGATAAAALSSERQQVTGETSKPANFQRSRTRSLNYLQRILAKPSLGLLASSTVAILVASHGQASNTNNSNQHIGGHPTTTSPTTNHFFHLTPDARACFTATYLCVLIVNNTLLDCNLLETLCNLNGTSTNSSNGNQYNNGNQFIESLNSEQLKAFESILNGSIEFPSGGSDSTSQQDVVGGAAAANDEQDYDDDRQQQASEPQESYAEPSYRTFNLDDRIRQDQLEQEPVRKLLTYGQTLAHKDVSAEPKSESEDQNVTDSTASMESSDEEFEDDSLNGDQAFEEQQQLAKAGRLADDEKNRILEYLSLRRKNQLKKKAYNRKQQQHLMELMSSGNGSLNDFEPTTSATISTTTTTTTTTPSSLTSWVVRPLQRGWNSIWPSQVTTTTSEAPAILNQDAGVVKVQLLRPIDRSEQYNSNDIVTNQSLKPAAGGSASRLQAFMEQQLDKSSLQDASLLLKTKQQLAATMAPFGDLVQQQSASESGQQQASSFQTLNHLRPLASQQLILAAASQRGYEFSSLSQQPSQQQQQQQHHMQLRPVERERDYQFHAQQPQQQLIALQRQRQRIQQQQAFQQHQQQDDVECKCNDLFLFGNYQLESQQTSSSRDECRFRCQQQSAFFTSSPLQSSSGPPVDQIAVAAALAASLAGPFTTTSQPLTAATMSLAPLTTSATISSPTSTLAPGKMNPLDVTFLLYTRYHRDLANDLAQLSLSVASTSSIQLVTAVAASVVSQMGNLNSTPPPPSGVQVSPAPVPVSGASNSQAPQLQQASSQQANSMSSQASSSVPLVSISGSSNSNNNNGVGQATTQSSPSAATSSSSSSSPLGLNATPTLLVNSGELLELSNETSLVESHHLNSSLPIKVIIHGFGSGGRRPWVTDMVYKLLDYEDVNVIVVDWEKGAALPNYVQAAGNTRLVGHKIATLIKSINLKYGLTGNSYHLIGFSLGAHVAGFAGMELRNMSSSSGYHWLLNRITGLDPASPLFEGYDLNDRLDPSDAQFVDVIHSNGDGVLRGGFGSLQPMGHVDFYPNGGRVQVGCNSVLLSALSDIIYGKWQSLCNHRRALNFFMDSFEFDKCRFRSFNCDSYESFLRGECFDCGYNNEKCSYMGYLANYSKGRGKMYLTTHEEAPFCANQYIIKIIGTKGYKANWGKVEVTLVTADGRNESFWLSSANQQTSVHATSSASVNSASISSTPSDLLAGQASSTSSPGGRNSHYSADGQLLQQQQSQLQHQHSMQSLIVAHPTLINFTQILLRYTKYKGWIYSGDESWSIDKVFITDSDGQVKSFCGFNTVLESHITSRLSLEPGNCTIASGEPATNPAAGQANLGAPSPANQQRQEQQQQQQQQRTTRGNSAQADRQQVLAQSIGPARTPRLFAAMIQQANQQQSDSSPLLLLSQQPKAYPRMTPVKNERPHSFHKLNFNQIPFLSL